MSPREGGTEQTKVKANSFPGPKVLPSTEENEHGAHRARSLIRRGQGLSRGSSEKVVTAQLKAVGGAANSRD